MGVGGFNAADRREYATTSLVQLPLQSLVPSMNAPWRVASRVCRWLIIRVGCGIALRCHRTSTSSLSQALVVHELVLVLREASETIGIVEL